MGMLFLVPGVVPETAGVWTNVSPAGIDLNPASFGGANFGMTGPVLADPTSPAIFYAFTSFQGCWKSGDYGLTWSKLSANGGPLDEGNNVAAEIASDGSYMLAGSLNSPYVAQCLRATAPFVTWVTTGATAGQPYKISIDPGNDAHVVASFHDNAKLSESSDAGVTWTDRGPITGSHQSNYTSFINATTLISVNDGDGGGTDGTIRGVWGGSSWAWTKVSDQERYHGWHQTYLDSINGFAWNPGARGIDKSTDNGATWTRVSTNPSGVMIGTTATLYAARNYATQGTFSPTIYTSNRTPGTSWSGPTNPTGMTIGPIRWAKTVNPAGQTVLVTTNEVAGIWRYVEP